MLASDQTLVHETRRHRERSERSERQRRTDIESNPRPQTSAMTKQQIKKIIDASNDQAIIEADINLYESDVKQQATAF